MSPSRCWYRLMLLLRFSFCHQNLTDYLKSNLPGMQLHGPLSLRILLPVLISICDVACQCSASTTTVTDAAAASSLVILTPITPPERPEGRQDQTLVGE